jgi:hypothetical protein
MRASLLIVAIIGMAVLAVNGMPIADELDAVADGPSANGVIIGGAYESGDFFGNFTYDPATMQINAGAGLRVTFLQTGNSAITIPLSSPSSFNVS